MVSLGTILYIMARLLPRIDDTETSVPTMKTHWTMEYIEKFDKWVKSWWEKTLRRVEIMILKLDNIIRNKLTNLKKNDSQKTVFPKEEEKSE